MKLVFTTAEVAASLELTVEEFEKLRPGLEARGFPAPLPGLQNRWSIIDVVNWINGSLRLRPGQPDSYWPASSTQLS